MKNVLPFNYGHCAHFALRHKILKLTYTESTELSQSQGEMMGFLHKITANSPAVNDFNSVSERIFCSLLLKFGAFGPNKG